MYKSFRESQQSLANIKAIDFFFAKEVIELILDKQHSVLLEIDSKSAAKIANCDSQLSLINDDTHTTAKEVIFHLLMQLMSAYSYGHSCIFINDLADKNVFVSPQDDPDFKIGFKMPSYSKITEILNSLDYTDLPIIFIKKFDSLYIKRLWLFENEIASFINLKSKLKAIAEDKLSRAMAILFPQAQEHDMQKLAVINSLQRGFSIISGGPGTGKTTTVTKLLLANQMLSDQPQKIALLAPTGKAAQRMTESLHSSLNSIDIKAIRPQCYEYIQNLEGQTIHRFLGLQPNSNKLKYTNDKKAPYDVIIIDEASMLDINIFVKLIRAVDYDAKLVLIGDVNQLPSVEAGSLLASFINKNDTQISAYTTRLLKNYRSQQYINNLANDVLLANVNIKKYQNNNINFYAIKEKDQLLREYAKHYKNLEKCSDYKTALVQLKKFRILVANKNIEIGTDRLNQKIQTLLNKKPEENYKARPIMITQNSYALGLYNGDVGIIWPDASGKLRAYFDSKEHRAYSLNMLPQYESVYVMTIHKTQGSEFDHVAIILPYQDNEALSKELLYTGITRAKKHLDIICDENVLKKTLQKISQRNSNISKLLH